MDATELNEVCRLCPSSGGGEDLMYVFDDRLSVKNNMKEVILVTTGVEIQETDLISKKICHRCCTKTLQMFLFRQDALTQDRALKEKCSRFLEDKGIRLPNTCITIKRERRDSCSPFKRPKVEPNNVTSVTPSFIKRKPKKILHPSVADIFKNHPYIKLPKKCLERHLAPVVSFTMGEVEKYFKKHKLDMRKFIYKKPASIAVAKKRTSFPTKQRTVSPIKISKKIIENHEVQNTGTSIDYVCTSVHKERKKSITSPDSDKRLQSKSPHGNNAAQSTSPTKIVEASKMPKPSNEILPETQIPLLETPVPVPQAVQTVVTKTPTAINSVSEDSRGSSSSGTTKPEFIESLGLTPTVTATKSQMLHVCNLCGSVHNNAFKLKTHTRKHMVCQFCKLRFKSLEAKQDHVDNSCQVKKIINSSGPVVELEKVHLNLAIRKKFKDAFSTFETIPGLTELESEEQMTVKAESTLSQLDTDDIIILSDNEQDQTKSSNSLLNVPTTSPGVLASEARNVSSTASVIKPEVRIKNNTILNNIVDNVGDKQTVKDLVFLLKPKRPRTVEKVLQTDLPATKDIKINNAEGFCEFKYLKEQLLSYQIPVSIINGPFHVAYQYKNNSNSNKTMALWGDLPVIDVFKKNPLKGGGNKSTTQTPTSFSTNQNPATSYQVQSTHISSSVPSTVPTNNSGLASIQQSPYSVSSLVENTLTKYTVDASTSSSATPLVQKFTQGTTSTGSNSTPVPKIFVKAAPGYGASTSRKSLSSRGKNMNNNKSISSSTLSRKSLPTNISNKRRNKSSVALNGSSVLTTSKGSSSSAPTITNNASGVKITTNSTFQAKTDSTLASETSRVRVKNVWELQ